MARAISLFLSLAVAASGLTNGFVSVDTDSMPAQVYLDGTTIHLRNGPLVVEAAPGKHFVSLFPPRKVYQAASGQAPEQFWERLRSLGAIGDQPGLMASYEAGAVRAGTDWIYVAPEDTVRVRLSRTEVDKTYRRDSGCVMRTFLGWTLLIGAGMIVSVILAARS